MIDRRVWLWLVLMLVFPALVASAQEARMVQQRETGGYAEDQALYSEHPFGLMPPPFPPHTVTRAAPLLAAPQFPTRFDYREQGVITGVRQQGSCGACYAFAALADFESKLLIAGEGRFDFSENNLKDCEWFGRSGRFQDESKCSGGTYWRVVNYMAEFGTVLETCDPYVASNTNCRLGCPYIKTALNWRVFSLNEIPPPETIKSYLMEKGPIFAAIDAGHYSGWEREFGDYDGSYTLYYTDSSPTYPVNHAVLIVGWDDTLSHDGGQGAWICKNSWGSSWGGTAGYGTERGYFTIAYGSANVGYYASFMEEWQDYDPCEQLLFYDEAGYERDTGYTGSTTAWGMCKFIMDEDADLRRVEFWTTDATTDVDIYIYDGFNGTTLDSLLASRLDNSYTEMGYHSVPLATPLEASEGEDIYVAVKFTNASYEHPLSTDPKGVGPLATGMCYMSLNDSTWSLPSGPDRYGTIGPVDLGIRLRVGYHGDCTPPDTVSGFRAVPGDSLVMLEWTNPADLDFSHVVIRYSSATYPVNLSMGSPVENGYDGEFYGEPSADTSFIHRGRLNNVTYYYTAFATDSTGHYAPPVMAAATPGDALPPGVVPDFIAEGGDRKVKLRWIGPGDVDLAGVRIRYSTVAPPLTLTDGMPVMNGTKDYFDTRPARPDSFVHSGLANDTAYYYTIWAFDGMTNYSEARSAQATTVDNAPPQFAISVMQNPYLSSHLDIYLIASEPILTSLPTVTIDSVAVQVSALPGADLVFTYNYEIYRSGPLEIAACAQDLVLHEGCSERIFNATRIGGRLGGSAASVDGRIKITVPGGALGEDTYILVGETPEVPAAMEALYDVSPLVTLEGEAELSIAYSGEDGDPGHLCIARVEEGEAYPIESYVDSETGRIVAYVGRLGSFGLLRRPGTETPARTYGEIVIYPNIPNPFSTSTAVRFMMPEARQTTVIVYSADGRLVRNLLDAALTPGSHMVTWDGKDRWGAKAADGIYFIRVSTYRGSATGKMVLLR